MHMQGQPLYEVYLLAQHDGTHAMVYFIQKSLFGVAVRDVCLRLVIASYLLFVGDALGEYKTAIPALVHLELLVCGKVVLAGEALCDSASFAHWTG